MKRIIKHKLATLPFFGVSTKDRDTQRLIRQIKIYKSKSRQPLPKPPVLTDNKQDK